MMFAGHEAALLSSLYGPRHEMSLVGPGGSFPGIGLSPGERMPYPSYPGLAGLSTFPLHRPVPHLPPLDSAFSIPTSPFHLLPPKYNLSSPYLLPGFPLPPGEMKLPGTIPPGQHTKSGKELSPRPSSSSSRSVSLPTDTATTNSIPTFLTGRDCPWFSLPYHPDIFR